MKKIIYGRMYDTETAELIAEHEFGGPEDFDYTFEALYRTPSKNYFIFGDGGPLSYFDPFLQQVLYDQWIYAKRIGPAEKTSGWDIIPMPRAEALEWCEIYDVDANVIEKEFGDLIRKASYFGPPGAVNPGQKGGTKWSKKSFT